ncbi:MAG TPA: phosphoribosyltransferase [Bryobacteraceae bacterium]|jgi:putative phosphoribosyl transferase|nr:phosphoribosyltransferase [Bryobacteraceae bacterium]
MFSKFRPNPIFKDRRDAGRKLAECVREYVPARDVLVLALPRGGVPVGYEVAEALAAELDVFIVRKIGLPGQEELAIGAIASGGIRVLNEDLIREVDLSETVLEQLTARERIELHRREQFYCGGRAAAHLTDRTIVLVDDGLATGASMRAACLAVREQHPAVIIVAVPVAARETGRELERCADRVVCVATPSPFFAVGSWYEDFSQTTDEEVQQLLAQHSA